MGMHVNQQYNVAAPNSLSVRVAGHQRRKMFDRFQWAADLPGDYSILDIGATADQTYQSSNYLEAWYEKKERITACGIDDASFLEEKYPGLKFVKANGLALPFAALSFDIVHSSAVIEHVGSFENQVRFIEECFRVARRCVFITTPNRKFPIEFHTVLPLVHWLPKSWFRALVRRTPLEFFSHEKNLNLMTGSELAQAAGLGDPDGCFENRIETVSLAGWPSNLLLVGLRRR